MKRFYTLAFLLILSRILDMVETLWLLRYISGVEEGNPIMRMLLPHPLAAVGFQVLVTSIILGWLYIETKARVHPWILWMPVLISIFPVFWNIFIYLIR